MLILCAYADNDKLLQQCSGFLIEFDNDTKVGIILTSANLICSRRPDTDEWLAKEEYSPEAKV